MQGNAKFSHNDKTRNKMVQLRNGNRNSINLQILHFRCGKPTSTRVQVLHGFFRCKLPEVVDIEVKTTSMQGMHIFRRDRMTQLIKCTPWSMRLHLHPTVIKKMKSFLEVENKMGPIIPVPANQFRPPLPETNPNVRKNDTAEKRKRATPKKKFRAASPQNYCNAPSLTRSPTKA